MKYKKPLKIRKFKKAPVKKAIKKANDKLFEKKVQRVINKDTENKIGFGNISNVYYNSGITTSADCLGLVVNTVKGTDDNQRIGDQTRLQAHYLKGCLQLSSTQTNISNTRIAVRLMVVRPKQYQNQADIISTGAAWLPYLLKKGGSTSAFTGTLSDLWAPINSDAITTYYDKRFYMSTPYQASAVAYADLKESIRFFSINLKPKNKLLKYDANIDSGLTPTNYGMVIIIGYVKLDGSAPDTVSTNIAMSYDINMEWQDN